ncbi:MAG: hypothetical protein ISR65_14175 [Bacteriovoracaceae bacterium]|nr:hypothetical protein [Bacteriovoracaceae bacterium]
MKQTIIITLFFIILMYLPAANSEDAMGHKPQAMGHSVLTAPGGLTDQEKYISEEYIHEGLNYRKFEEECGGDAKKRALCKGRDGKASTAGMVNALAKAYTMIIGTTSSTIAMPKKADASKGDAGKADQDNEMNDYCKHIATLTEAVGAFKQMSAQENIDSVPLGKDTAQRETLHRAARSHKARSDVSKIQASGWGGTTACYTGMIAYSAATGPAGAAMTTAKSVGLKLAAAGLLTGFYYKEIGRHKGYADKVLEIADKLPHKGDCNPATERDCYCLQPETMNDPQYCLEQIYARQPIVGKILTTCIDKQMEEDPECKCAGNDDCYDQEYMSTIRKLNFGNSFNQGLGTAVKDLSNGQVLGNNDVISRNTSNQMARGKKALKKYDKLFDKGVTLTAKQEEEAKALSLHGIPHNMARAIASKPMSAAAKKIASGIRQSKSGKRYRYRSSTKRPKKIAYAGSRGRRKRYQRSSAKLPQFGKQKVGKKLSGNVIRFAEQAQRSAQINKNKDRSIFKIISRRYQVSGRSRLQFQ